MSRLASPQSAFSTDVVCRRLAIAGCLAAILGAKILLIARCGISTPYWDQWDAEAAGLYLPWLSGALSPAHWFAFHNEHRIVLTRATALALLWLNGNWDPIVQMLFNAAVHVTTIGLLIAVLGRLLDPAGFLFFAAFALLLFAVPFGWDNTLGGFQVQFYYLILLSLLGLHLICHAPAWTARWLAGTLLATAAYFAMASGALILPAAIVLACLQLATRRRAGARELAGIALHAALVLVLLRDALSFSPHAHASIGAAIDSFMVSASWPIAAASWPPLLRVIPAVLINAPLLVLMAQVTGERARLDDRRWFALALAGWFALQLFTLSYGRPGGTPESRYNDIFIIGIVLNAAVWLHLLRARAPKLMLVASIWLFAVMLGAGQKAMNNVIDGISARLRTGQIQTENVKNFVSTGDSAHLSGKPHLHIPFPSDERLRELLSEPKLRAILPPALTGAPEGRVKTAILSQGPMLLPLGLALLSFAALALYRRRNAASGDPPQSL
jgi:hypothetical protein